MKTLLINNLKKCVLDPKRKTFKLTLLTFLAAAMMGCSHTLLSCGVDGDSSYLTLETSSEIRADNARLMHALCTYKPGAI